MVARSKKQAQPVQELTEEEWDELVDRSAQHFMQMSGEEFKRRWEAGEYPDPDGTPAMYVASLLPGVG